MIVIKWDFPTSKIEVTKKVVFAYCDSPNVNSPLGYSPNRGGPDRGIGGNGSEISGGEDKG